MDKKFSLLCILCTAPLVINATTLSKLELRRNQAPYAGPVNLGESVDAFVAPMGTERCQWRLSSDGDVMSTPQGTWAFWSDFQNGIAQVVPLTFKAIGKHTLTVEGFPRYKPGTQAVEVPGCAGKLTLPVEVLARPAIKTSQVPIKPAGVITSITMQPGSFLADEKSVQVSMTATGEPCYFRLRTEGKSNEVLFGGVMNGNGANSGFQRAFQANILGYAGAGAYTLIAEPADAPAQAGNVPKCGGLSKVGYTVLPKLQIPAAVRLQSIQTAASHKEGAPISALVSFETTACTFSLSLRPVTGGRERSMGWYYQEGKTIQFHDLAAVFGRSR